MVSQVKAAHTIEFSFGWDDFKNDMFLQGLQRLQDAVNRKIEINDISCYVRE